MLKFLNKIRVFVRKLLVPLPFVLLGTSVVTSVVRYEYGVEAYDKYKDLEKDWAGWGVLLCAHCLVGIRYCWYNKISLLGLISLNILNSISDFTPIADSYIIWSSYLFFGIATIFIFVKWILRLR